MDALRFVREHGPHRREEAIFREDDELNLLLGDARREALPAHDVLVPDEVPGEQRRLPRPWESFRWAAGVHRNHARDCDVDRFAGVDVVVLLREMLLPLRASVPSEREHSPPLRWVEVFEEAEVLRHLRHRVDLGIAAQRRGGDEKVAESVELPRRDRPNLLLHHLPMHLGPFSARSRHRSVEHRLEDGIKGAREARLEVIRFGNGEDCARLERHNSRRPLP
mmetsp:Transcript_31574/g.102906  ORF Transcript_31574/g.102906 Transcript_31574/m.102906 type:complete len:222 (-) Transcript_31574:1525-2190(-)